MVVSLIPQGANSEINQRRTPIANKEIQQAVLGYSYIPQLDPRQIPQSELPQVEQEYAMRPPAPYYDTGVPHAQQQSIRNQTQESAQPEPVYTPAPIEPEYTSPVLVEPLPPAYSPVEEAEVEEETEAEEEEKILGGTISGSLGVTSDYVFRGVTQSREMPAVQGGVEYEHDTGAYVGLWVSNVDFVDGDQAQIEVDSYGGYRAQVTDDIYMDVGGLYYSYPGAHKSLNYDFAEFYVSGEYALPIAGGFGRGFNLDGPSIGASFYYSPEYFAKSGTAYYLKATATAPFENGVTLDGHIGKQWIEDNLAYALPDYIDWSLGVAYALPKEFEVKVQYTDTNIEKIDCADGCDAKAVATVTKSF